MDIVYAIQSRNDHRLYIGITNNIERRLKEHNGGRVFSTKGYRPWQLAYTKKCQNRVQARQQEKKLKSGYGKELLKRYLSSGVAQW